MTRGGLSLLWRVFLTNASILAAATTILAVSPATISFPVALTEAIVLVVGAAALLALNYALLRRVLGPLHELTGFMRSIDPLRPGQRVRVGEGEAEVTELAHAFNEMLGRLETERRESARRALLAQEGERVRIARELHDEVGQTLTAVVLGIERAARGAHGPVKEALVDAREGARAGLEDVREIARRLRPEALDDLGLGSALTALTTGFAKRTGLRVERSFATDLPALTPEAELVIYRVAQEALTNAARHADAGSVELRLERSDGAVLMRVSDDGRGIDPATERTGIRGMRERALLIGAHLSIARRAPRGTEVRLEVPVP